MDSLSFDTLQFNQSNLQDYLECKRRFFLKHIQKLTWPAIPSEPVQEYELFLQKGIIFHRLAHQYFVGISEEILKMIAENEGIADWWSSFIEYTKKTIDKKAQLIPEKTVKVRTNNHVISVRYDLLVVDEDKIHIIDWKTSQRPFIQANANRRIQSRLYLFVLKHTHSLQLSFKPGLTKNISMSYWFAQFPNDVVDISYGEDAFIDDGEYFTKLMTEIKGQTESDFLMTNLLNHCKYCVYRSLCDRGSRAGNSEAESYMDELDLSVPLLDFENIPEIEF